MSENLSQGQPISLTTSDGATLNMVRMGLGWKARKNFLNLASRDLDLDASAVLFARQQAVDAVFFRHLASDDGAVRHSGDNRVGGAGTGQDDESITVDLRRVPAHIDQIVFTVNSYTGQTFSDVRNAFCRLVDEDTGQELVRYTFTGGGNHTAQVMAKVSRTPTGWRMQAIGAPGYGRTFRDLMPAIAAAALACREGPWTASG